MSGKIGMKHTRIRPIAIRNNIWRSMRIMRRFTMPDIMRTVPGLQYVNLRKFVKSMLNHGIVAIISGNVSGRAGSYAQYRLVSDLGPDCPIICPACGRPLSKQCEKTKTDTDTQTGTQDHLGPEGGPS